jgi:DNA-binding transcriptional LysR family regulator
MRLEQIEAFLAIAESGNFQQAAQRCGINQSTISRQIQSLEEDLRAPLFHRRGRAKLTLGGEIFLPKARRIAQEWQSAQQEISDLLAGKQTELCVAIIDSICGQYLPPVLEQFQQVYPEIQLRVSSLGSDRALKVLRDGLVDIAIIMENPALTSASELVVDVLMDEPIALLMAAAHPLATLREVSWDQLSAYPQITFKDGYGMQRLVQQQFQRQGLTFQPTLELNALDAFRGVVRQGRCVALLPASALADACHDPTLVIRPTTTPTLTRRIVLVTTDDRLQIPPIRHFRRLCQDLLQADLAA